MKFLEIITLHTVFASCLVAKDRLLRRVSPDTMTNNKWPPRVVLSGHNIASMERLIATSAEVYPESQLEAFLL